MYLKEIRSHGFKSFADKICIEMKNGITCIVGPNGSGKSNVVDAVRWVLGEQSIKSLRGDGNMADVIFSGSKSRKPLNTASVTLIFDNSDNYLKLPNTEVSIKRIVYRDGSNEYYLNGEKCRLKDINDILLDTGIAKESFNVISQGKIEEILNSKPSERRTIFEEAAGVLKYERRKEDALRKLDKTNDNISRVNDIVSELEKQVEPLKVAKEKALKYTKYSKELETLEVSLVASDITKINYKYQKDKEKVEILNQELLNMSSLTNKSEVKIEEYKSKLSSLEKQINEKNQEMLQLTSEVSKINAERQIIIERQKYSVSDSKLHDNLVSLKERKLALENSLSKLELEIKDRLKESEKLNDNYKQKSKDLEDVKQVKVKLDNEISDTIRNANYLNLKIEQLEQSINENTLLPYAVRCVLSNPKLKVHNALGNLIEVKEEYAKAITTSLGLSFSNIVVDDEVKAKEVINYLKVNNVGRVTLYPLNIMKAKCVDDDTLREVSKLKGYINIGSNLVTYDKKYDSIIRNQLGNVIIVDNIDNANVISKKIKFRYKIVTLDGEILNVGGSITGGNVKKTRNIITDKYELEGLLKDREENTLKIKSLEEKINENDKNYKLLEDELYLINKNRINLEEVINSKQKSREDTLNNLRLLENDIKGTDNILNNTLNKEEEEIINKYYKSLNKKESLENTINNLNKEKQELQEQIANLEFTSKRENAEYNKKTKELKELEIEINRFDVKLDMLLTTLNEEYSMTYEKAVSNYKLEIEENEARLRVNDLKGQIKEMGNVNLDAPAEYDKVSERYEFLIKQKEDLESAESTLLGIIDELDEIMKKEFISSFELIRKHFNETFNELFKGGSADLKLTDPDNILESGIEIVASPPGKKLSTISLLSGGEKTFTAISLVFAILKSRCVPFCIFDEVEAALDEANVDSFGKYLQKLNGKTQFILITHKKRTMEYADVLYGITMQESGVSKLVSVKLEDVK